MLMILGPAIYFYMSICIHPYGNTRLRHDAIMSEAFSVDEYLALDVINQLQNSSHC
jgi:hypothetical protein